MTEAVAEFLRHRPSEMVEDGALLDSLRGALSEEDDFTLVGENSGERATWSDVYRLVPGRDLDDRVRDWISRLEKQGSRSSALPDPEPDETRELRLAGAGLSYRVPAGHAPESTTSPELRTAAGPVRVDIDIEDLRALARRLDDGSATGVPGFYEKVAVDQFLGKSVGTNGTPIRSIEAGPIQLTVAPTGTGKSVFSRLLALHLASRGVPVAILVPDIPSAWKETIRLEDGAKKAGMDLAIVPLSSWRKISDKLEAHLEHPPKEDLSAEWALRTLGYSCLLNAYSEVPPDDWDSENEPCTRLRQIGGEGRRDRRVACPFRNQCGRFSPFKSALSADILVVNHHSFLSGRVPFEVSIDGQPPRRLTTAELVLRRSGVLLIDEVDLLQTHVIGANSRNLVLSSRGRLSKLSRLYSEVESRRAESRIDSGLRFERGRSALLRIIHESERLSELINRNELEWPERGRMTWREAQDAWLATRLFGRQESSGSRLRSLFDNRTIDDDPSAEKLRSALAPLGPGLGDGTLMVDIRLRMMEALAEWPSNGWRSSEAQRTRDLIVSRLIVRAVLVQLDQALEHLRPQLPGLEQQDVSQAADLRDDLLGYVPWQPSPTGALGRRLYGYQFSRRPGDQGALETSVIGGDPHGFVREIGGLIAHSLAGEARAVLGLSATCRFRGAPCADVLAEVVGWVPDTTRNFCVTGAEVETRVSGVARASERTDAARNAASQLWQSSLSNYLTRKLAASESRGRARALVVTGSYREAKAAAEGLREAIGTSSVALRYLVRDEEKDSSGLDAISRRELEAFGEIQAPAILVGPLAVVARGHNILQPGTNLSAISGVFVLTRPVPPSHDADRLLAHLSYNARLFPPEWKEEPSDTIEAERREAWRRLRILQRSSGTFRHMDPELRRELVCDVLADLAQLAGRARRGGTPVDLVFVDAAFQDEFSPWRELVKDVLEWWKERGWIGEMRELHGALVAGLAEYSGFETGSARD